MKTLEIHGRILFEVIWSRNEPKRLQTELFAATVYGARMVTAEQIPPVFAVNQWKTLEAGGWKWMEINISQWKSLSYLAGHRVTTSLDGHQCPPTSIGGHWCTPIYFPLPGILLVFMTESEHHDTHWRH